MNDKDAYNAFLRSLDEVRRLDKVCVKDLEVFCVFNLLLDDYLDGWFCRLMANFGSSRHVIVLSNVLILCLDCVDKICLTQMSGVVYRIHLFIRILSGILQLSGDARKSTIDDSSEFMACVVLPD